MLSTQRTLWISALVLAVTIFKPVVVEAQTATFALRSGSNCRAYTYNSGRCVTEGSSVYYSNYERCSFTVTRSGYITATEFQTESCCDHLTVNSRSYSGSFGPRNVYVSRGSTIYWTTDGSVTSRGFTLCGTGQSSIPPPPPTSSRRFVPAPTSRPGTVDPSIGEEANSAEVGIISAIIIVAICFGVCICMCCCYGCCGKPFEEKVREFPHASPGFIPGFAAIILIMAAMSTYDTIRIQTTDASDPELYRGMFRWALMSKGSVELSGSITCAFDATSNSDLGNLCPAGSESDCCKSRSSRCEATQAFVIIGFLISLFVLPFEIVRSWKFPKIPVHVSIGCCVAAAVCYIINSALVAYEGLGWIRTKADDTDDDVWLINTHSSCGLYDPKNPGHVRLSGGYACVQWAFGFTFLQALFYWWWAREQQVPKTSDSDIVQNPAAAEATAYQWEPPAHSPVYPAYPQPNAYGAGPHGAYPHHNAAYYPQYPPSPHGHLQDQPTQPLPPGSQPPPADAKVAAI